MLKRLSALVACLLCITVLSAQKADKTVTRSVEKFFTEYNAMGVNVKNCALERRRNNIIVNQRAKKITIYANSNFAAQIFTPEIVDSIYAALSSYLPREQQRYKLEIFAARRPIE